MAVAAAMAGRPDCHHVGTVVGSVLVGAHGVHRGLQGYLEVGSEEDGLPPECLDQSDEEDGGEGADDEERGDASALVVGLATSLAPQEPGLREQVKILKHNVSIIFAL